MVIIVLSKIILAYQALIHPFTRGQEQPKINNYCEDDTNAILLRSDETYYMSTLDLQHL